MNLLRHVDAVGLGFSGHGRRVDGVQLSLHFLDQFALIETVDAIDELCSMIEENRRCGSDVVGSEKVREMIGVQTTDR